MWIALLWWALAGGGAWAFGAAVIVLAVAASLALQPTPRVRISLPALFPFLTFFALRSVHAGFDVARRALSPRLPIAPSLVDLRLRLPPGPSRVFLADIMSLLPGTLSADLVDDRLRLHVLDTRLPTEQGLRAAEAVVAALFGQTLIALPGEP
ncbi:MAG: Na+/H+ antiporter subunit E [Rubrivivax sp.]|nr:Na+/H+ antiporter subunit E [Rubrivivax sp.]